MQRIRTAPRPGWQAKVEERGLDWHTTETGELYWDESVYWRFDADEIDRIEAATETLWDMCRTAVARVVETGQLAGFGYAPQTAQLIERSWKERDEEPSLYARFDLAYDGRDLKLLELNGDTPTSLVEAAVIQWWWLQDTFPDADQFNSIHEKLIAAFQRYAQAARAGEGSPPPSQMLHLTCVAPHAEDEGTLTYIAACADEAGVDPMFVSLKDIGWREGDGQPGRFVDGDDRRIETLFKLVPWEWLLADPFGQRLAQEAAARRIRLIEPAWKMLASNKRLLVTLWQLFPDHELLLEATMSRERARAFGELVRKPVGGREGENVSLLRTAEVGFDEVAKAGGHYDDDDFVYQRRARLAEADGAYAVIGSWVVRGEACGMGVRESSSPITGNTARFVPHLFG
jgi:glutathionylspermidine synthase